MIDFLFFILFLLLGVLIGFVFCLFLEDFFYD